MCKKIAESLIEQRRYIEHLKHSNTAKFQSEQMNEKLEKIYVLIEFLKKKINSSFEKTNEVILEQPSSTLNMSISESLKNIEYFLTQSEHKLDEEFEIIDASLVREDVLSEDNEDEIRKKEKETAEILQAEKEAELKRIEKELKEEEAKKERIFQEKLLEQKRIQEERQAEEKRLKDEIENKERLKKEIEINIRREYEAKLRKEAEDLEIKTQNILNSQQHEKVLSLIQTMRNQKWEHTRINIDILKEQFFFVQDQLKQLNYEIKQLGVYREKRVKGLTEFHDIVLNYDKLCDIKSFTAQFNVFYWLFQQQPSMGEFFLKHHQQSNPNTVPTFKTPVEVKQAQIQNESYTFTEDYDYYDEENEDEEEEDDDYVEDDENNEIQDPKEYFTMKNRMEMFNSVPEFHTPEANNVNANFNSNIEKRSTKNKDKSVSASNSMYHLNTDTKSKNAFFNKTIGDIKFPTGLDVLGSMKTSASKYLLELSNEKNEEEEGEEGEENNECDQETDSQGNFVTINSNNISSTNFSQATKDDTFVSCNEGNTFTNTNNSINIANNSTKSSINDLQIAFENNGNYYKYCDKNKSWIPVGKCNMQIIIDEMSVKGKNIRLFNLDVYGI